MTNNYAINAKTLNYHSPSPNLHLLCWISTETQSAQNDAKTMESMPIRLDLGYYVLVGRGGLVVVVVDERVSHAGGERGHGGALRDHAELHQEHAGAHGPAPLVRVRAVAHGRRQARQTSNNKYTLH